MKQRSRVARTVILMIFVLISPRIYSADTDVLIKGTTDFVLDRAYDNYLYVLQMRLTSNPLLPRYLPNTVRVAQSGDLRLLFTHGKLWRDAVEKDLAELAKMEIVKSDIAPVLTALCPLRFGDSLQELCKIIVGENPDLLSDGVREATLKVLCAKPPSSMKSQCERILKPGTKLEDGEKTRILVLLASAVHFSHGGESLQTQSPLDLNIYIEEVSEETKKVVSRAIPELVGDLYRVQDTCSGLETGSYTSCIVAITELLREAAHVEYVVRCRRVDLGFQCRKSGRVLGMYEEDRDFSTFLQYAMFFAQMADAEDKDTVKALLKSVTVPPVSFGLKRAPFRTGFFLTSYVGGAFVTATGDAQSKRAYIVAAPIGLEWSQATYRGNSFSLLLSPIDLGYPISLKLADSDAAVKTSDIVVPGVYLFYGWKNYPIAAGVGYTRVRSIDNPDRRTPRVLFVLALDMPLFALY
jgi:hypothetical protein